MATVFSTRSRFPSLSHFGSRWVRGLVGRNTASFVFVVAFAAPPMRGFRSGAAGQRCIRMAVHRRAYPPSPRPPPPLLPFQCLRLTAKVLLRRLRCQEDLRFKCFGKGGDHRGTLGGRGSQPNPLPPPLQTPPLWNTSLWQGRRVPHPPEEGGPRLCLHCRVVQQAPDVPLAEHEWQALREI